VLEWHGWTAVEAVGTWVAGLGTLLAVITALFLGRRQLRDGMDIARKQNETATWTAAKGLYLRYLELCVENPDFGDGMFRQTEDHGERGKYEWFFAILGYAAEEILKNCPSDLSSGWRDTLTRELCFHHDYIREKIDDIADDYEEPLAQILRDIAAGRITCNG
jgi:hypothetical protein